MFSCPVSRSNLAQASLAGKRLADGQVLRLEKGLYPLMTLVQWRMKWGEIAPALRPATPENRSAWLAKAELLRAAHQTRMEGHAAVLDNWKRTSGGDPAFARMLRLSRFTNVLHCTAAVGRGGFQGESGHYSIDANYGHAQLWPVYRRVMGFDLTPDREYPDYLPRKPSVPTPNKEGVLPERPEASGIRGMRSLAFDFSGDAGVPCLFVVVDRIEGGEDEQRRWLFQTDTGGARDVSPFVAEVLAGSGFRLKDQKGPATLRGTFAHPPDATVSAEPMVWEYIKTVGTGRGETVRKTIRCLSLPGTDHFFFVGTVSPDGKDPEIQIEGKGLDAVIRVGKRRIHFDGEKIVLGKIEE